MHCIWFCGFVTEFFKIQSIVVIKSQRLVSQQNLIHTTGVMLRYNFGLVRLQRNRIPRLGKADRRRVEDPFT